jgi:hypothetical protein
MDLPSKKSGTEKTRLRALVELEFISISWLEI